MTPYGLPHHGLQAFHWYSKWRLTVSCHSEWRQECCLRKRESGTMTRSEESITLMTAYRLSHHGNRSFTRAQDDVLPPSSLRQQSFTFALDDVLWFSSSQQQVFDIASGWRLSSVVILNGGKNAVQEKRETGQWHRVKNLWFWWHLTAFLTTGTEPSHSLRMTFNVFLTTTANPLLIFRMTPNGNHMLRLLTHS